MQKYKLKIKCSKENRLRSNYEAQPSWGLTDIEAT
jgi:hypothetical protein